MEEKESSAYQNDRSPEIPGSQYGLFIHRHVPEENSGQQNLLTRNQFLVSIVVAMVY